MFCLEAFGYQPQCQPSVKRSAVEASGNCNPCFICFNKVILVSASIQGQSSLLLSIYLYVLNRCTTILILYKKIIQKKPNNLKTNKSAKIPRNTYSACLNFSEAKRIYYSFCPSISPFIPSSILSSIPTFLSLFLAKLTTSGVSGAFDTFGTHFTYGRIKE